MTPKLIASLAFTTALALQTWGEVNTALASAALSLINEARPYFGPTIIALCLWIIAKINENTKLTRDRIARGRSETTSSEAEPVQGDNVHREDV